MSKESLKKWRGIWPGILVAIYTFIIVNDKIPNLNMIEIGLYLAIAAIAAVVYYGFSIRNIIWYKILNRIVDYNIADGIECIKKNNYDDKHITFTKSSIVKNLFINRKRDKVKMDIFYNYVDNNETLKEKSKCVMFNGLILTSVIDVIIITVMAIIAQLLLIIWNLHNWLLIGFSLLILVLSFLLCLFLVNQHIELGNEQLNFIDKQIENISNDDNKSEN